MSVNVSERIDTFKLLSDCRKEISVAFREKYGDRLKMRRPLRGSNYGYHITGFDVPKVLAVRMQIKEGKDEKRKMHFGRFIPSGDQHNYFLQRAIIELEGKQTNTGDYNTNVLGIGCFSAISDRHPFVMYSDNDCFTMPKHGLGISLHFKNPAEVGRKLLAIDNLVDEILRNPCADQVILKMADKINRDCEINNY
jgi:hypothetical protein